MLASTQISDKSHSWLANSSPLAVTGVPFLIIDLTVCILKLLGGQLPVFWALKPLPSESQ